MRPPSDDELILYYYGESADARAVEEAIEGSPELARHYDALRRVLDAVPRDEVPSRSDLYGRRLWREIEPRLASGRSRRRPSAASGTLWKAAGWAVAATLLVVVAFWAGRTTAPEPASTTALSDAARQRILQVTLIEHLERSRFLLEELVNEGVEPSNGAVTERAHRLTADNRIYRQAARGHQDAELVVVLEELERFLTELSHLDAAATDERRQIHERLIDTGLLFKIRVLITALGSGDRSPAPPPTTIT